MQFGQNVLRMTWKERFVLFSWKAHFFPVLKRISGQCYDFEIWRSKMRFGQNLLRMTWKERFVQFSCKPHCFPLLKSIWDKCNDFEKFDPQKYDLGKTSCTWPDTSVLYNFHKKCTVFPFWRGFQASVTILRFLTFQNAIWPKRAAHDLKRAFCTIFMKSALFPRFGENFRPVWRFWQLWRSKMRFGQNVLRMTWKERFVQFSWKAHCFPVFKRIWDKSSDFEKFDPEKYDLGKTSCAWPETSVLYNFHKKHTVFPFWRGFQASVTILTTLTLKNAIWPKRAAHDMKRAFCTIFMESALFSRFEENFRPVLRFWNLTLKNAIWPKRPPHDLKRAFCTIFMKSALFSRFEEFFRPVWRIWHLWPSKMQFGQNVLRMTWKERFLLFSWKAHYFPVFKRIWDKSNDFEKFDPQKYDLGKTSCAWPETSVLYNFHGKRTVFSFWGQFQASLTILRTLTLKNAIWPKRAAHDLKIAFCKIFMKSALFSLFGENLRPVWRFWQLWRTQIRFGQNVLRMIWKERFVQFSWKATCFPVLERIWGQCDDFDNFDPHKCDLAKTCCAWP